MPHLRPVQINHRFYDVNGIVLHVPEAGNAHGEIMLFLHGFPEYWYAWKAQLEFFAAEGYRAVAPDLRGYNLSGKPSTCAAYRIGELTGDAVALIGQLTDKPVVLVAHDWGGILAWRLAAQYPSLFSRLVVINMPHPAVMKQTLHSNVKQLLKSWYVGFFQLPYLPEWASRAFDCALLERSLVKTSNPNTFSPDDIAQYKAAWKQPGAMRAMINWYRAYIRYKDPAPVTGRIIVPALLVWGKNDRFLSHTMAAPSVALCDDGRLVMIADGTHWVHHEKPVVNEHILHFISGAQF